MLLREVDLVSTNRCNLRCSWCYARHNVATETPAEEVARVVSQIEWCIRQYRTGAVNFPPQQRQLKIYLYGGEPTVAWGVVEAAAEIKAKCDIPIYLVVVTNMLEMGEDRIDWCAANRIDVSSSIDGCAPAQDFFRVTAQGKGVSEQVYRNARVLASRHNGTSCRSTIAPETAQWMFESMLFLVEDIGFSQVIQVMAGGVEWSDEALAVVREQTRKTTDWWIDNMRNGVHRGLFYLNHVLPFIWNPIRKARICHFDKGHAAIDVDGTIYPCHRFCGPGVRPEYRLGSIQEGGATNTRLCSTLARLDLPARLKDRCSKCPAAITCNCLCLHEAMLAGGGMFDPLPLTCRIWPFFHAEAMRAHVILTAEKNQTYLQQYSRRPEMPPRPMRPNGNGRSMMQPNQRPGMPARPAMPSRPIPHR